MFWQALTTGGIPGFIDVVLNMDSSSLQEDSLISQMKFANKKLVFYGDDTWIKLFPGHFERADGTTSFFVTDYTEVQTKYSWINPFVPQNEKSEFILKMLQLA